MLALPDNDNIGKSFETLTGQIGSKIKLFFQYLLENIVVCLGKIPRESFSIPTVDVENLTSFPENISDSL